jgi:hypothetical protein
MSDRKVNYNGEMVNISTLIKDEALSKEEAQNALNKLYEEADDIQRPFGETVKSIMIKQGITKKWGGQEIIDTNSAAELTGLNEGIFKSTMYKPDCTISMSLVISMCIGFMLGSVFTSMLLNSAGLHFRLTNPEHIAYLFLLEHCKDSDIEECNAILEHLGIPKTKQLGSTERGEYKTVRKNQG